MALSAFWQSGPNDVAALAINDSNRVAETTVPASGRTTRLFGIRKKASSGHSDFFLAVIRAKPRDINNFDHVTGWQGSPTCAHMFSFLASSPAGHERSRTLEGTSQA